VQQRAFFRRYRLSVNYVPQTQTINLFLRGGVDAASAMWYNEYHLMLMAGLDPDELTTFFFSEHDVNFPEDGIYCRIETFERDPELCARFVQASIEGWMWAFENPEQALDIVMHRVFAANIPTDRCHQRWMLNRMRDIILVDDPRKPGTPIPLGVLRRDDYADVSASMLTGGAIDNVPAYTEFYKGAEDRNEE
jgi:NitT/TauT family transport system substrate-binding protein